MANRLTDYLRRYFGFTSTEIRGFLVLIPLIILFLFVPEIFKRYLRSHSEDSTSQDAAILEKWKQEISAKLEQREKEALKKEENIIQSFDPNTISREQWLALGFRESVADRIEKYLSKGGRFRESEDVMKIYGINSELLLTYYDHMVFESLERYDAKRKQKPIFSSSIKPTSASKEFRLESEVVIYDLNKADTTALKTIRGIGSYWAKKVVTYREALGGFVDRMQVYEIYYMKDSVADLIIDNTSFVPLVLRQINVNVASAEELSAHPYMNYKLANSIVKYRDQHGRYESLEDLKKIYIVTDEDMRKLTPYLKISD